MRVLIAGLIFWAAWPAAADTIRIRADTWCPYNCLPGSAMPGYMIEVARIVFQKAGHSVEYQTMNWTRSISGTRNGTYTAVAGASKGDAPDFLFPGEELGRSGNSFWVSADSNWQYAGVDSLKTIKLGLIQDYDYGEFITQYSAANPDKVEFTTGETALEKNIRKLELGRLGAVLEDDFVFRAKMKEVGKQAIFRNGGRESETTPEDYIYIAFSPADPKSAAYVALLNEGIKALRASGELESILAKYGLSDWK